jgi:1,4-alpha-glucan branching enzyme/nitrous oxide reductase accessory protein NosL
MRKAMLLAACWLVLATTQAQLLVWTPQFPNDNSSITVTMDATSGNQGLFNHTGAVYMHMGVITNLSTNSSDWRYVATTWGTTTAPVATAAGTNKWTYTINNPRTFFNVPAGETILRVAMLFRDAAGTKVQRNADGSDIYVPIFAAGTNAIQITQPLLRPTYNITHDPVTATVGSNVPATAIASTTGGTLRLLLNGTQFSGPVTGNNTITGNATITAAGNQELVAELTVGANTFRDTVSFFVTPTTTVAPLPAGVKEGINYAANCTSVTLVLYAPNKTSATVIGDFPGSNWQPQTQYQMNRTPDGNYYWLTINGLTSGTEYGFQYVVDNNIYIADPYCEKVLDPWNDQFIPASTFPNLKPYPNNPNVSAGQNGIVGVLQTCAPAYNWQVQNFVKPDKRNLMTYELLVRDFGGSAPNSFQLIIDTISYLKRLGINALELMPVGEFSGNQSWGYNPTFFFAIDKAYGPKNKLKELIDTCHANGIAVIMDVVYNHEDAFNTPHGKLYWNAATGKPAANNPWLNIDPPHPYNVFQDFNHTSAATQYFVIRNLRHWIEEYKIDGFRFDLAKGFTQTQSNTTTVENYDASRVANLKRYYDSTITLFPNTYMILEFLGQQRQEEQEYANMGYMLWTNCNVTYNQATMGFNTNSNFSKIVYNSNESGYTNPAAAFGYMESHDEERLMYRNIQNGNVVAGYSTKDTTTALNRMAAAASVFFTVPGPKMLWQFGERGYDISLEFGGSNVSNKPPRWDYMGEARRLKLWNAYRQLIKLRLDNPAIFNSTNFTYDFFDGNGLVKRFQIADPSANGKKVTVIANLDVTTQTRGVTFQTTGLWENYLSDGMLTGATGLNGPTGSTFTLTNATQNITLQPGEYHVYVSNPCATSAPTVSGPVTYCQGATATALTATGTGLLWYTTASGGTGSATAPTPSTATAGSTTFYVSQTLNGCEGPRAAIVVTVNATPAAPTVTATVAYCQGATATALTATGSNLLWYTTATGGTGTALAPTPSTTATGTTIFYVSQTINSCEGPRAAITVTVNAVPSAPSVTAGISYCQGATAMALTATGSNLLWYSVATGGAGSTTAPTPSTASPGSTIFYVSQTVSGCESPRASITVTINAIPAAPTVSSPVTYCQNGAAVPLTATGSGLLWYTTATGGTGNATAPTPITTAVGSTNFYVSQTINGCEGPRALITVNVTTSTPAPVVSSPVTYCQNATATALTATGSGLLWYTTATGGTGSATAPVPSTAAAGSTTFYVSQTTSCGEGPRAAIVVNVNATPVAPTVTPTVTYCQNATATALTATGSNLLWYTVATGGTGSATAPTPSTTSAGSTTFYVSQTVSGCEGPRASITITVNATPAAPTVSSPVTYCQGNTAMALTATGSNLLWYTVATGGTGSATAPTPSTASAGSTTFYVSQTINGCEGPRASITVTVNASPAAPTVTTPVTYCQNATATALTATGSNLLWYTVATGGTGSATAPVPSTASAGSTTYYVSQSNGCGEGPRAAIVVTVNATPAAPTVTTPVTYCQGTTATALTATGSNLLWYTVATGGTGSATAPTPSTTSAGSTTFYVSQTINGCEGPRASIVVTVNATPLAPTVTTPVTYCQNATATALTATGSNLLWYTAATGGTGSATAPVPSTASAGNTIFYVSQTVNGCEGPRAAITVTVTALPAAPTVTSPVTYCQNTTAVALTATGTGLLWYTVATGGTGSATAPVPTTTAAGSTTFYVSQSNSCGAGPRAPIVVNVTATPAAPTGLAVTNLTINSATLNWATLPGLFYTAEYRLGSSGPWTTAVNGTNNSSINITGLAPGTGYEWRVSANCAPANSGNYANGPGFTTTVRNSNVRLASNGFGIKITPNPVSKNGIIDFVVPKAGIVTLTLRSSAGQILGLLYQGVRQAGPHQFMVTNQLLNLAAGVYCIRVEQNGKGTTLRFVKENN